MAVTHDVVTQLTFTGSHTLSPGDVVRFMPMMQGDCTGAAAADWTRYGGALDDGLSTWVQLPGGVDNTDSAVYCLCLVEHSQRRRRAQIVVDADFAWHGHVRVIVSHLSPSPPHAPEARRAHGP